jgi:hypothetical protein
LWATALFMPRVPLWTVFIQKPADLQFRASRHRNQHTNSCCKNLSVVLHMKHNHIVKIIPNITGESSICEYAEVVKFAVPNLLKTRVSFQNLVITFCRHTNHYNLGLWCSGNPLYLYSGGSCFECRPEPSNPSRVLFSWIFSIPPDKFRSGKDRFFP